MQWWFWIFGFLMLACLVGIVVVITLALQTTSDDGRDIDVVLYQYPVGNETNSTTNNSAVAMPAITARTPRLVAQVYAVRLFMPWVRNVYVLGSKDDQTEGATFVSFAGTPEEAFAYMPNIPGVAPWAIFLSDYALPLRPVKRSYWFTQGKRRMFNVFRDETEVAFFRGDLEDMTLPCLVTDLALLKSSQNWHDMVFREVTEEKVVLCNDMNRDVMIAGRLRDNMNIQLQLLADDPPYFATFHVSKNQTPADAQIAHEGILKFFAEVLV